MKAELITIEAVGNLLTTYRSDLEYIRTFQKCKRCQGIYLKDVGVPKMDEFLSEYRVARNREKGQTERFLKTVIAHVKTKRADNVDYLAKRLKDSGITHGKTAVSLASKILFLNNPWEILPYDQNVRFAIEYSGKSKTYSGYIEAVQKSKDFILIPKLYHALPKSILAYLKLVEDEFATERYMHPLDGIRKNRFFDKILWAIGRNKKASDVH